MVRIDVAFDLPPPVPIGSSNDLLVGQKVFAIGNPFGLDYTFTSGLVSALDRSISLSEDNDGTIDNLIQTDAAINPGNSGGPLLDSAGRLIGINTAIYSPSGTSAGIGFAVPVDTVNRVVPQLIALGKYSPPTLGITVDQRVNERILSELGISGVLVLTTGENSAAEKAGLRKTQINRFGDVVPGDVIQAVDNQKVNSVNQLLSVLDEYQVGDQVSLRIWRNGQALDIPIKLQPAGT